MIDNTKPSLEEIEKLEEQIQIYKSQRNLRGYKVTFYVRFDPTNHDCDMLTSDGYLDAGLFNDYIANSVFDMIESDYSLDGSYEATCYVSVEELGHEEIQKAFGGIYSMSDIEKELARLKRYDEELSAIMPKDFKDWWENSKEEWPIVARGVIENLCKREELAWEQVNLISEGFRGTYE